MAQRSGKITNEMIKTTPQTSKPIFDFNISIHKTRPQELYPFGQNAYLSVYNQQRNPVNGFNGPLLVFMPCPQGV